MNLSDAFSWPNQQGEDEADEEGLEMKLDRAKGKEEENSASVQDPVPAVSEAAEAAEEDIPRV